MEPLDRLETPRAPSLPDRIWLKTLCSIYGAPPGAGGRKDVHRRGGDDL